MSKEYFFISGLPRSGSTLLSSILKQNPEFHSDISSPLCHLVKNTIDTITNSESNFTVNEEQRKTILHYLFEGYYKHINKSTVFDTSRQWTANTFLLKILFPNTKILCCVRDIVWILDSFEKILLKNSLYSNTIMDDESRQSVEARCMSFMSVQKNGVVIKPLLWLEEGITANPDMIMLIDYEDLCKQPKTTMQKIYKFINRPYFEHNFDSVAYKNKPFDISINLQDLHTIKNKVEWVERKSILPTSVINQYKNLEFWKQKDFIKYE